MPHILPDERKRIAAEAGRRGGEARRRRKQAADMTPPSPPPSKTTDDKTSWAHRNAAIEHLGEPATWSDWYKSLQVEEQGIINSRRQIELDLLRVDLEQKRGHLLTREQVDERDAKRDELILSRLQELVDAGVRLCPLSEQAEARRKMSDTLAEFRRSIAEQLKALP